MAKTSRSVRACFDVVLFWSLDRFTREGVRERVRLLITPLSPSCPAGCEPHRVHSSPACGPFHTHAPLNFQIGDAVVLFKSRVVQLTASNGVLHREQAGCVYLLPSKSYHQGHSRQRCHHARSVDYQAVSAFVALVTGLRQSSRYTKGRSPSEPALTVSERPIYSVPVLGISITFGLGFSLKAAFSTAVSRSWRSGTKAA
jgi:hypothetical protein